MTFSIDQGLNQLFKCGKYIDTLIFLKSDKTKSHLIILPFFKQKNEA